MPSLRKTQEGERAGRGPEMGSAQACGGCDAQRHRRPAASRDTWLRLTSEKTGSRRGTQAIMRLSEDRPPSPEGPPPWNRGLHCDPRPCPPPCAAKATGHFFNGHDVLKYRLFYPPPKKKKTSVLKNWNPGTVLPCGKSQLASGSTAGQPGLPAAALPCCPALIARHL